MSSVSGQETTWEELKEEEERYAWPGSDLLPMAEVVRRPGGWRAFNVVSFHVTLS